MTQEDEARRMRVQPSTNLDGLDLTVEEARAMSGEEFKRLFGFARLDDVPLVAPGHLDRAPRDAAWYVRVRPAPKNPGPRERQHDSFELVVKRPPKGAAKNGEAATVGGNPKRIGLRAQQADAAQLEALVFLARKAGRRRRATQWPIERIQSLLCTDLLDKYVDTCLAEPPAGGEPQGIVESTRIGYRDQIRAFQRVFPELEVGDVGDWIVNEYHVRAKDRSPQSRRTDLCTVRRALKEALILIGVRPDYALHFKIRELKMLPKVAWTAAEYDRLRAAAEGWRFNPDGTPMMVRGVDGFVQDRRNAWVVGCRQAWRRAIEFLPYCGNRNGRLPPTRWVPPEAEPADGLPLDDRPWIEFTDEGAYYHCDGEARYDGGKRRGGRIVPPEFVPTLRAWYEEDLAKGFEFVFHKPDGARYQGRRLHGTTFRQIARDAGLSHRRIPHHLKDLCVQWADEAGVGREALAVHIDTTARTIARKYGEPRREAQQQQAAERMSQSAWRERGEKKAKVTQLFKEARAKAAGAPQTASRPRRTA